MLRKTAGLFIRAWPPRTWPLILVLVAWPVWYCYTKLRPAYDYWAYYNSYLRAVPVEPEHYDSHLMSVAGMRHEHMIDMLVWGGAIIGVVVLVLLLVWLFRYLSSHSGRSEPGALSMRNSNHPAAVSGIANPARSRMSTVTGGYAVVQRPNQELLLRALNTYMDVMRALVLERMRQEFGHGAAEAIRASLSQEAAEGFERELARSGGILEEALDIGHFRPVVENYWDRCFSTAFRHDGSIPGALGWITGARNRAAHPGTADLDARDALDALDNIARVMDYAGGPDIVRSLEEMKARVRTTPTPPAAQSAATSSPSATSKCANTRCDAFNTHEIGPDGRASLRCESCSAQYSTLSFVILRFDRYRERGQGQAPGQYNYSVRIRLPDGREDILEFSHPSAIGADRGDSISFSYDSKNTLVFLLNCGIDRTWRFEGGGDYRRFWQHPLTYVIIVALLAIASCQYALYQLQP